MTEVFVEQPGYTRSVSYLLCVFFLLQHQPLLPYLTIAAVMVCLSMAIFSPTESMMAMISPTESMMAIISPTESMMAMIKSGAADMAVF